MLAATPRRFRRRLLAVMLTLGLLPLAAWGLASHALTAQVLAIRPTQLEELLVGEPQDIQDEIIRINTDARHIALQVALAIPLIMGLLGLFNSFRMMRQPEPEPSAAADGMVMG